MYIVRAMTQTRTVPSHVDSTGKLLNRLALMTGDEVRQKGRLVVEPRETLLLQPSLARDFFCVAGCTACCLPFTLDYCPEEWHVLDQQAPADVGAPMPGDDFNVRTVEVNGEEHEIWSYPQYEDDQCPYLRPIREDGAGGCSFVPSQNFQPLECAAAPQILNSTRGDRYATLSSRPFGRGWAWKDKPQCEFTDLIVTESDLEDLDMADKIDLLKRYQMWADHLSIDTVIPEVIEILSDFRNRLVENDLKAIPVPL